MRQITELSELKRIELEIMKKIHAFCVEKDIKYYLCYGTLIGALRHGGFIPWDDDIDIFMFRSDYNRFCECFPVEQEALGLTLVNSRTKPCYCRAMSKVIDNRTILYESEYRCDDPIGVFVDIWPLDNLPEEQDDIRKFKRKGVCFEKILYKKAYKVSHWKSIKDKILSVPFSLLDIKKWIAKEEKFATSYLMELSTFVTCISGDSGRLQSYKRDWFGTPLPVKFEDTYFNAPQNGNAVLTAWYGDWRELPPKEKQKPHHIIETYWK